jgi:CheY-like chemotaxis protein
VIERLESEPFDLVLLDLHMPEKNGFEVLEHVKTHPRLRMIPVVMLSSSIVPSDVDQAYQLHANAYVEKRATLADLSKTLDAILRFWIQTAVTPLAAGRL